MSLDDDWESSAEFGILVLAYVDSVLFEGYITAFTLILRAKSLYTLSPSSVLLNATIIFFFISTTLKL